MFETLLYVVCNRRRPQRGPWTKGASRTEIVLLLRPSAGMGNDDKRDAGEGEIDSGCICEMVLLLEVERGIGLVKGEMVEMLPLS
jgi:hypothetical protein